MSDSQERVQQSGSSIPLPPGWTVKEERGIGFSMRDEQGTIISQHPYDSVAWRVTVLNDKGYIAKRDK